MFQVTINADDYGIDTDTTQTIITFIKKRYCDTTTVMTNMDGYADACSLAEENGLLERIGLHLNLMQGEPITRGIAGCDVFCRNGQFGQYKQNRQHRLYLSKGQRMLVEDELRAQIERYLELGYKGMTMDSHQGVHMDWSIYPIVLRLFQEYHFKLLRRSPNLSGKAYKKVFRVPFDWSVRQKGIPTTDYMGNMKAYRENAAGMREGSSVEIMVHPAECGGTLYLDWCSELTLNDYIRDLAAVGHAPEN